MGMFLRNTRFRSGDLNQRKNLNQRETFFKNKKCLIVVSFILLLLAFFCFLKINQNSSELEISNSRDADLSRLDLDLSRLSLDLSRLSNLSYFNDLPFLSDDIINQNAINQDVINRDIINRDAINQDAINRRLYETTLNIPKLEVNAEIESVGLNSKNEMGVPSNDWNVAWYNLGTKPGEIGSAVIAGHLDNRFGKPAVFWNLGKLEIGDDVFVVDNENIKKHFKVISLEKYATGTAPLERIFGANDGAYLNLITCGGVWDKTRDNYTERFVVFTEYVSF